MTRAALAAVAIAVLALAAHVARADADWKAAIECKTGKTLIRDARWVTLTKPLACSIRVFAHGDLKGITGVLEVVLDGQSHAFPGTVSQEGTRKAVTYIDRDGSSIWYDEHTHSHYELVAKDGVFSLGRRVLVDGLASCADNRVKAAILDGDDQVRWEGKADADEECFGRGEL